MKRLINQWIGTTSSLRRVSVFDHFSISALDSVAEIVAATSAQDLADAMEASKADIGDVYKAVFFVAVDIVAVHLGGEALSIDCRCQCQNKREHILGGVAFSGFTLINDHENSVPLAETPDRYTFALSFAELLAKKILQQDTLGNRSDFTNSRVEVFQGSAWELRLSGMSKHSKSKSLAWTSIVEMHRFFGPLIPRDVYGFPVQSVTNEEDGNDDLDAPI